MQEALFDEAFGIRGMIGEAAAKLRFLKNRLPSMTEDDRWLAIAQIEGDLATYKERLDEISLELNHVPDIYTMDDSEEEWPSGSEESLGS